MPSIRRQDRTSRSCNSTYALALALCLGMCLCGANQAKAQQANQQVATNAESTPGQALARLVHQAYEGEDGADARLREIYSYGLHAGQQWAREMAWTRNAAAQGNPLAEKVLGYMYEKGYGVPQDYALALNWYRKAAAQGNAEADGDVGYLYDEGLGVPKNETQALAWYRKAAALGEPVSEYNLGYFYEHGLGVRKDYAQAHVWYRKAAAQFVREGNPSMAGTSSAYASIMSQKEDEEEEAAANWNPWARDRFGLVAFRSACSQQQKNVAEWLVQVRSPHQIPLSVTAKDSSGPAQQVASEGGVLMHLTSRSCKKYPEVTATRLYDNVRYVYVYRNGKVKQHHMGGQSTASLLLADTAQLAGQYAHNQAMINAAKAQAAQQQAQEQAAAAQRQAAQNAAAAAAAQQRAAQAEAQTAQAQRQAAQAQRQAAARQSTGGYNRPAAGATSQAQRQPLQVHVVSGSVEEQVPHESDEACGRSVDADAPKEWYENFSYSVWTNEPASVSLTVTLSNGDTVYRQFNIPLGGTVPDSFQWKVGCGFYPPQELTITNIDSHASRM